MAKKKNERTVFVDDPHSPNMGRYIPEKQFNDQFKEEKETVNHPQHYGGDTTYEAIKVIQAWDLGFCLGNTVKYIARAGKKDPDKEVEDLKKAAWYLNERIKELTV